jgi:hypothetical protein
MTARRGTSILALALWLACVGLLATTTVVIATNETREDKLDPSAIAVLIFVMAFATVGALVAARRPRLPIGWLLLMSGFGYALAGFSTTGAHLADTPHSPFLYLQVLSGWMWGVSIALTGVYLLLRFPDGKLLSPRWRIIEWVTTVGLILFVAGVTFNPGHVEDTRFDNPLGIAGPVGRTIGGLDAAFGVVFAALIAALVSVFIRYRRSDRTGRQQLKWVLFAAALQALAAGAQIPIGAFVKDPELASTIENVVSTVAISFLPVAIGIAVLRYRLWDIDRLINRTIVYLVLTVLLVGVYAGLVVGLGAITGRTGNPVLIAGSTLVVAALFGPARRRIQALIDRRFYRQRYDAERVLSGFSARLRDELELDTLSAEIRSALSGAMQPSTVALWIRPSGGNR